MTHPISPTLLGQLSGAIAAQMGLHFPKARWRDLERGIHAAAQEFEVPNVEACMQRLISSPLTQQQMAILASHLTVGETYFFREKHAFALLEEEILPALVRTRRGSARRLRIWSAGCATGEEPYSIAIALRNVIPAVQAWQVTLLATDINPRFLQKASEGVYSQWSFRDTPLWIRERYFTRQSGGRWAIRPEIKQMVQFASRNVLDEVDLSPVSNGAAMDVIFCRNVLMYLAPDQVKKVVQSLYRALADGGWLIVSPSETSHVLFAEFLTVNTAGGIFYRKDGKRLPLTVDFSPRETPSDALAELRRGVWLPPGEASVASGWEVASPPSVQEGTGEEPPLPAPRQTPYMEALALYQQGRYTEVADKLGELCADDHANAPGMVLLARACANQGRLAEARQWCEKALAADKLNAGMHYLHATILQEQSALDEAIGALKRALYLEPRFVLAHWALGTLALRQGKLKESGKHVANALALLSAYRRDDILPESDGITAGRLREIITSTYQQPQAR
jgi:chemotaxis protein methyltransferase CheR